MGKFIINIPPKKKYLIYDSPRKEDFEKYLPDNQTHVLNTRWETINLFVLLKCLMNFNLKSSTYFKEYINYVNPKYIISFSDLYPQFFYIEKKSNRIKILIQNAWRDKTPKKNKNKKYFVDYFLGFNPTISKRYENVLHAKIFNIGSFRSNSFKIYNKKKSLDILYISTYRIPDRNKTEIGNLSWEEFDKAQKDLVKFLFNYCKKKKLRFHIYGKATPSIINFQLTQKNYFKKILGNENKGWVYLKNLDNSHKSVKRTYKIIDSAQIVVGTDSTLLYEALSRGNKVAFFNHRSELQGQKSRSYAWPLAKSKKGPFWTNELNQNSCQKLIDKVLSYNKKRWKRIFQKETRDVMLRDENNTIFNRIIKNNINR